MPLLIGMILVIAVLDIIMPGLVPKWAISRPIFVPLFIQLDVPPQTVLAAYRVGDSPLNTVTPLNGLPAVRRDDRPAVQARGPGIGTIIALMIPYALDGCWVVWIVIFSSPGT